MASLISAVEASGILVMFEASFDTWSRNITVFKEPLKTAISSPSSNLFGFGEMQQEAQYSYTLQSGIYPAIIRYNDIEKNPALYANLTPEALARIYNGPVSIKVRRDCRDYLNNGLTERVIVDGQTFLVDSDERLQTYQGSEYYIFSLRKTK